MANLVLGVVTALFGLDWGVDAVTSVHLHDRVGSGIFSIMFFTASVLCFLSI